MNSSDQIDSGHLLTKKQSQATINSEESCGSNGGNKAFWSNLVHQHNDSRFDNVYRKPSHSYSSLISEAIRLSVRGQLTLNEIYTWLLEKFPYFQAAGSGWKNSIRHTLSTNQKFVRVPRPAKEPGKGAYWTIRETDRQVGRGGRKQSESSFYTTKADEDFSSLSSGRNSSTISQFEQMPEFSYYPDSDSTRFNTDLSSSGHHHLYLPSFQPTDKTSHFGFGATLPPPNLGHSDLIYGIDSHSDYHYANHSSFMPRASLSRESSSFFDDWTLHNSLSTNPVKLNPLNLVVQNDD